MARAAVDLAPLAVINVHYDIGISSLPVQRRILGYPAFLEAPHEVECLLAPHARTVVGARDERAQFPNDGVGPESSRLRPYPDGVASASQPFDEFDGAPTEG